MGLFKRSKSAKIAVEPLNDDSNTNGSVVGSASSKKGSKKSTGNASSTMGSSNDPDKKQPLAKHTFEVPQVDLPPAPNPSTHPAKYLRSINAVRERSNIVLKKAQTNQLNHFDVDLTKLDQTVKWVTGIIKRDYAPDFHTIPPHGRWQHFDVGGRPRVDQLLASWPSQVDTQERTRRVLDLFLVSVLLDAGAGTKWGYKSKESGRVYKRSEGLAVASLEMFKAGLFSSDPAELCQVDSKGLRRLTVDVLARGLQVTEDNPIEGLEGRTGLLVRLGDALTNSTFFGETMRPGNLLDYLLAHPSTQAGGVPVILVPTLWDALMDGLMPIWPASRTKIDGVSLGDAWPCSSMPSNPTRPWENIVPFHKLTQWLCYSLMTPMTRLLNAHFVGVHVMTGLPEYRNGGLLVDTGLITLKKDDMARGLAAYSDNADRLGRPKMEVVPMFTPDDDVIVEWRAVTVGFLDTIHGKVNEELGLTGADALSLAQVLEAGTWKGGREIAEVVRPNTKEPPIMILSDGTVF